MEYEMIKHPLKIIIAYFLLGVFFSAAQGQQNSNNPNVTDRTLILAKVNDFFNNNPTMIADFLQITSDGRRAEGQLLVQKPGRMHFEYNPPEKIQIIADGTSVAVRDKKLATQDVYFISQTPLKFLLSRHIDLAKDLRVLEVIASKDSISILVEDKATFGGTSRIKLIFDPQSYELKQWTIIDPQGYETLVSLFNLDLKTKPDPSQFKINYEKFD
jgi:outer membrane lipoprotein-sorting protein